MTDYLHERSSGNWLFSKMRALAGHATVSAFARAPAPVQAFTSGRRVPCLFVLLLVSGSLAPGIVQALPETSALPGTRFEKWQGVTAFTTLADDTTLAEFSAETIAVSPEGYRLRISFMPRFDCEPVISVVVSLQKAGESEERRTLAGIEPTNFRIDGEEIELPAIIDDEGDLAVVYYQASTPLAQALRQRIDAGNLAILLNEAGESVAFSLFGSTRAVSEVERRCRQHEPDDV